MRHQEGPDIVDLSALRMRIATVSAGIWLTYAVVGAGAIYIALTWDRPNRAILCALFGTGLAGTAAISLLPREQIVRSRYREAFFLGWSVLDFALLIGACAVDGGTASPIAPIFFIPVVFSAMSYPLASVVAVAGLTVSGYLAVALAIGGQAWSYEALFSVGLACTCAMSAWQARNHERQRSALIEVSRADPLTGCLNRRGFEELALAEIAAARRHGREGAVLVLDVDHFKQVNDRRGHAAGDELLRWVVATLRKTVRAADAIGRLGGDEFAVLLTDTGQAEAFALSARVARALSARAPSSVGLASFPIDGTTLEELARIADSRLYASRHGRSEEAHASTAERLSWAAAMARAVDMRMDAQHEHSVAVAECAVAIATALGWQPDELAMLRIAGTLADVGKVCVPDDILRKRGPLSTQELDVVKSHSAAGAELVSRVDGLQGIVGWIRHSHERFDGGGYPDGLGGRQIPQASRIILVADAFDAMTSRRPYREPLSVAHACSELERHSGSQFDPECVRALLHWLSGERRAGETQLATGSD